VDRLASAEPAPGGGSASAIAASLGAALVAMVASLSQDRPRYAAYNELHAEMAERGRALATQLLELADADADAYTEFAAAMKMPKDPDAATERTKAMQIAARRAAQVPLATVEACREVVVAAEALAGRSNRNASSDLNVAALLATAAAHGAAANVRVNLPSLDASDPFIADAEERVPQLVAEIERLSGLTQAAVATGAEREPLGTATVGADEHA